MPHVRSATWIRLCISSQLRSFIAGLQLLLCGADGPTFACAHPELVMASVASAFACEEGMRNADPGCAAWVASADTGREFTPLGHQPGFLRGPGRSRSQGESAIGARGQLRPTPPGMPRAAVAAGCCTCARLCAACVGSEIPIGTGALATSILMPLKY